VATDFTYIVHSCEIGFPHLFLWILCSASWSCLITVCRTADGWRLRLLPLLTLRLLIYSFWNPTPPLPARAVYILDVSSLRLISFSCFRCIHLNAIDSTMAAVPLRLKKYKSSVGCFVFVSVCWTNGIQEQACVIDSWSVSPSVGLFLNRRVVELVTH
jgi:hypothetical protein